MDLVLLPEPWKSLITIAGPTVIALALFLVGFFQGWWRTVFEVEVWKDRSDHAEHQIETLLPAVQTLTAAITQLTSIVEQLRHERNS